MNGRKRKCAGIHRFGIEVLHYFLKDLILGAGTNIMYRKFNITNCGAMPVHTADVFLRFSSGV